LPGWALVAQLDRGTPVICLPGNPLAAMLAALVLLAPTVEGMLGRPLRALDSAVLAADIPNPRPGSLLVPSRLAVDGRAAATGWSDSGMMRGLALADVVVVVPPGGAAHDQRVSALRLPWTRP
jgi:molybdopterin molybdotransferase